MLNREGLVGAAFCLVFTLQWAAAATPGVTGDTIKIGSCLPKTGALKATALAVETGFNTYIKHINDEKKGVLGRKIDMNIQDDEYVAEKTVECFQKHVQDGVFMFAFSAGSVQALKIARLAEANKIPSFGYTNSPDEIYEPLQKHVFGTVPPWSTVMKAHADLLWNAGIRKIAMLYMNDAPGNAARDSVLGALKTHGGDLGAVASYPRNSTDLDAPYKTIKDAKPEAIVYMGGTAQFVQLLKMSKADNLTPVRLHVIGQTMSEYAKQGDAAEGMVGIQWVPYEESKLPAVADYKRLLAKYYPEIQPSPAGFRAFIEAKILEEGLRRAGKDLTRDSFIAAMESMNGWDVGLGPDYKVSYSPTDHQAFNKFFHVTVKNGEVVILKAKDWNWKKKS